MTLPEPAGLERLCSDARRSIEAALDGDVPENAIAFYARWWQLETWLRSLVYLELRAG